MKNLFVRAGLALACSVSVGAMAAYDLTLQDADLTLKVNGVACETGTSGLSVVSVNVNGTDIDINTNGVEFTCGSVTVNPPSSSSSSSSVETSSSVSSSSSSAGAGTPPAGVDLSACGGTWPAGVIEGNVLSLAGAAKAEQRLLGNNVISFPVQTLDADRYSRVIINGTSGTLGVARRVWISACPGGPALPDAACSSNSMEATTIRLQQGPKTQHPVLYCNMPENKQYFINVENSTCASSTRACNFYREIK